MIPIGRSLPQPLVVPAAGVGIESGGEQTSSQSFADLLGGVITACTGPAGFLEDQKGTELPNPADLQGANVFNENGFFYGATAGATRPGCVSVGFATNSALGNAVSTVSGAAQVADWDRSLPIDPSAPSSSSTVAGPQNAPSLTGAAPLRPSLSPLPIAARSSLESIAFAKIDSAFGAFGLPANAEAEQAQAPLRSGGSWRGARVLEAADAKSALAVSLQALDHGQAVVVQLGSLDSETRLKLRDRIVALLSRHGLTAHSVRIYGRSDAAVTLEKGS